MNKNLNKFKVFTLVMLLTVIMVFVNVMQVNAEGILCAKGEEVNNKIEEVVVSHTKKDYNGASDNWQVNNYQYVFLKMSGTINNEAGNIKEGDYFTVKLDERLRPNGIVDEGIVSALIPYLTFEDNGNEVLLAVPNYNKSTKTIRYIFTKNIENVKKTDFKLTFADYPDLNKATDNGTYTFKNSYAGKEYSYTYELLWENPLPAAGTINEKDVKSLAMITNVNIKEDGSNGNYTHRAYARFYNLENDDEIKISWTGNSAFTDSTDFRIYGVSEAFIDSYGVDANKLEDITDKFVKNNSNVEYKAKYSELGYENFLVEIKNDFKIEEGITSHTGFNIVNGKGSGVTTSILKDYLTSAANAIKNREPVPCREVRQLEITKVDSKSNTGLENATFDLFLVKNGAAQDKPIKTVTTGIDGKATIDELDYNQEYLLVETKAPSGYILNKEPIKVNIEALDKGEAVIKLSIKNDKDNKTDSPTTNVTMEVKGHKTPETGDSYNIYIYLAAGVVALIILLGLVIKKHKNNK